MEALRFLDILGFVVGLVYLWLEYKASIWLWLASIIMPAIDMVLYYKAGLYADFGMAIYYCLAALYGYLAWTAGKRRSRRLALSGTSSPLSDQDSGKKSSSELPVTHFKKEYILPAMLVFVVLWFLIWWFLSSNTNSTVPLTDAFTTALSIVALWALARKYAEQWLLWLVVDAVCAVLYVYKGIPFKACIYAIYTVFAVFGYRKWLKMIEV